jgi:hypothetical protein
MENTTSLKPLSLGETVITSNAVDQINLEDVRIGLCRHASCDWGEVCADDAKSNNDALLSGCRVLSAYTDRKGVKFWIITEADRSATTVLLPEDY